MKKNLKFLIEINKLKEMPRTGWVLMGVKNPETVAEHTFRTTIAAWLLGRKKKLNIERVMKIALFHDLCEVYAGDMTPFSYFTDLPKGGIKKEKKLMKWVRLSKKDREKRGKIQLEKEKKSLLRLIKDLNPRLKRDIFSCWSDFEQGNTKEGRFVKQLDKIEALIQSIEYFGTDEKLSGTGWWEGTEEVVDDPLLLDFLKVIQKKFYGKLPHGSAKKIKPKKEKELENILDFLLEIGKLKRMPRLYWTIREVKDPESVVGHMFTLALMVWIFGTEERLKDNMGKILKMALCHEMSAVYTGDTTPYDSILPKGKKQRKEVLKRWQRLPKTEKARIFIQDYKKELKAFEKLTSKLEPSVREEIIQLWQEYRTRSSPEGHFVSQLNVLAVLLQALLYKEKHKRFSPAPMWEWAFELSGDPISSNLMKEMKKRFY